jgi:hypothetical protein
LLSCPPPCTFALCTCAIDAAATGSSKREKMRSIGLPNAASMVAIAIWRGKGAILSCRSSSSSATLVPTTSGRVARNCPSLTYEGPSRLIADGRLASPLRGFLLLDFVWRGPNKRASLNGMRAAGGRRAGSRSLSTPARARTRPARVSRKREPREDGKIAARPNAWFGPAKPECKARRTSRAAPGRKRSWPKPSSRNEWRRSRQKAG